MSQENHGTKKIFGILLPDWVSEDVLKKFVYSFLSLIVAILMSSIFIWPRFAELYSSAKELEGLKKSLKVISDNVLKVDDYKNNLGETNVGVLEMAMPRSFDPGLILTGLRQVSVNTKVALEAYEVAGGEVKVEPELTDNEKGLAIFKPHKVNLRLVGESGNLIKFIDLLGTSLPFSVISEMSLSEISNLLNQQGVSQLEVELTYFESRLIEINLDKIVGFSSENTQLFEEVLTYSRPSIFTRENVNYDVRQGSIFGF